MKVQPPHQVLPPVLQVLPRTLHSTANFYHERNTTFVKSICIIKYPIFNVIKKIIWALFWFYRNLKCQYIVWIVCVGDPSLESQLSGVTVFTVACSVLCFTGTNENQALFFSGVE